MYAIVFPLGRSHRAAKAKPEAPAMYVPDHYRVQDIGEMHALMRARPFAALVSAGASS